MGKERNTKLSCGNETKNWSQVELVGKIHPESSISTGLKKLLSVVSTMLSCHLLTALHTGLSKNKRALFIG